MIGRIRIARRPIATTALETVMRYSFAYQAVFDDILDEKPYTQFREALSNLEDEIEMLYDDRLISDEEQERFKGVLKEVGDAYKSGDLKDAADLLREGVGEPVEELLTENYRLIQEPLARLRRGLV